MATDADTIISPETDTQTPPDNGGVSDSGLPADQGGEPAGDQPVDEGSATDWRTTLAGEDKELLGFLGRYHSQDAALKAWKKTHDEMRSGKFLKPLPENPTDEEVKAYRAQWGIPEDPKGYMDSLPEGLVVGDDDSPFVGTFLDAMHKVNAPASLTSAAVEAYYSIVQEQEAAEAEAVQQAKNEAIEELRQEWGPEYRRNLTIMNNHLATLPEAVKDAFTYGKGPDGKPLGYNPEVLRWLTSMAMEANPVATVVPGAGSNQASAIADELSSIQKMMGDRNSDYWKGPKAAHLQERYLQLVEAQQKLR